MQVREKKTNQCLLAIYWFWADEFRCVGWRVDDRKLAPKFIASAKRSRIQKIAVTNLSCVEVQNALRWKHLCETGGDTTTEVSTRLGDDERGMSGFCGLLRAWTKSCDPAGSRSLKGDSETKRLNLS